MHYSSLSHKVHVPVCIIIMQPLYCGHHWDGTAGNDLIKEMSLLLIWGLHTNIIVGLQKCPCLRYVLNSSCPQTMKLIINIKL